MSKLLSLDSTVGFFAERLVRELSKRCLRYNMEMEKKGRDQGSNECGRRTEARLVYIPQGCSCRHEMRQLCQRRSRLWQIKLCELDSINDRGSQYIAHSKTYLLALGIKIVIGDDGDVQTGRKGFTE